MTLKEIKVVIESLPTERYPEMIAFLSKDERTEAKKIALSLSKKLDAIHREEERLIKMFHWEEHFQKQGLGLIGGIDEAGRGPLAGPVVAACVIFPSNPFIQGINDSKKLSKNKREELFERIIEKAFSYGIGMAEHEEIDQFNILEATMLAMRRAVAACPIKPEMVLVDGNQMIRRLNYPQKTLVQGDAKSSTIACASILAKVTRDRLMEDYAQIYPEYGFEKHKGYGTTEHIAMINKEGACKIHRKSFIHNFL